MEKKKNQSRKFESRFFVILRVLTMPLGRKLKYRPELTLIVRNIGWMILDKFLRMGLGLFVGVWFARYLGPDLFGQFSYALAFVGIFNGIASIGLNGIVVRDIVRNPKITNVTIGTAFAMQLIGGVVATVLINIIIVWIRPSDTSNRMLIAILSLGLVFKATDTIRFWFESQVQFRYIIWVENSVFALASIIKIFMILHSASLASFVWLSLVEVIAGALGLMAIYTAKGENFKYWKLDAKRAKTLFFESWPLMLAGLAVALYMRVDMVMLQEMSNTKEVGIYAAATRISEIFYLIPVILIGSMSPAIIKLHGKHDELYLIAMRNLYAILVWIALLVTIPTTFFAREIIFALYGANFESAAIVLAIHLWASIAVFLGTASSQHLLVNGWQKISFYRTLIGMMCNLILNYLMIPGMGAVGAAIATVISYYVATFSLVFFKSTRNHTLYMVLAPIKRLQGIEKMFEK
jgi:O-antigen/teichoic acid export membrane protein